MVRSFDPGERVPVEYSDDHVDGLRCPRCDHPYLHHERVRVQHRPDEDVRLFDEVTVNPDGTTTARQGVRDLTGWRRGSIVIDVTCEECHFYPNVLPPFELRLVQHKGVTLWFWQM